MSARTAAGVRSRGDLALQRLPPLAVGLGLLEERLLELREAGAAAGHAGQRLAEHALHKPARRLRARRSSPASRPAWRVFGPIASAVA